MKKYLIEDVAIRIDIKRVFAEKFGLIILDAHEMTTELLAWENWFHFEPAKTLVIMPGNGASMVKIYINIKLPLKIHIKQ